MQKIVPNLWFADAAAGGEFYAGVFPGSRVRTSSFYPQEGLLDFQKDYAGKPLTVDVEIDGYRLVLINAGDTFRPNPSISLTLSFADAEMDRLDALWAALADGGRVLMPLQEYPYSARYGWVEDRFGVSWQLTVAGDEQRPPVMPTFLFSGPAQNRAREAIEEYTGLFPDAQVGTMVDYQEKSGPADAGAVMYADFTLAGQWFTAMDSAATESHPFTEGVSLQVECADQAEIDRYWAVLSQVPQAEQCGWCKDRFGVSWQIVPGGMDDLISSPAAYAAMMEMHKIDIEGLRAAAS
ncbi:MULTISPECIES: VOC family protein [Microbacterium]|nr:MULTISPECIES: VOC family protein [Microbacterium]